MGPDKLAAIELFMEHYCRVMARIVNEWGRLDKFMRDGIMVIFWEDILLISTTSVKPTRQDAQKAVVSSVCFAIAALKAFRECNK